VIQALGSSRPTSFLKLPDAGLYKRAMHLSHGGEWDYDLELKTTPSSPVRVGWLRAILLGHQRVAAGLHIQVPILVLASTLTNFSRRWQEDMRTADTVLDVEQIAARAIRLGRHVTVVRITDGLHDLMLSAPHVRKEAMEEIGRFLHGYLSRSDQVGDGLSEPRDSLLRCDRD
jgi:alpha-beta hydrolase superfamily lysophospholipase